MGSGEKRIVLAGGSPGARSKKKVQKTYFIFNPDTNTVKIGKAVDPVHRLKTFQCASSTKLELLYVINDNVESKMHRRWAYLRVRAGGGNEWFQASPVLLAWIKACKEPRF